MEVAQFKISHSSELYAEGEDDDDVFQKSRSEVGNNVYWDKIRVMSGKNLNQNILNFSCRPKDEMGLQGECNLLMIASHGLVIVDAINESIHSLSR